MKKIVSILLILLFVCGCQEIGKEDVDPNQRYFDLIDAIKERDSFTATSNYFDIYAEMAKIDDGYRYYVFIDNPKVAIYDIESIAIEKNVDYSNIMAANIGIFEEKEYSMIPNQKNPDKGYVPGLMFSATCQEPSTTLYIYVSFKNEDYSNTHIEYFKLDVKYGEE